MQARLPSLAREEIRPGFLEDESLEGSMSGPSHRVGQEGTAVCSRRGRREESVEPAEHRDQGEASDQRPQEL